MKQTIRPDACPILHPSKSELATIRSGWAVFEEFAFKGRCGACIGDAKHPYSADTLHDLAEFVRGILIACDAGNAAAPASPPVPTNRQEPNA